MNKTEHVPIKCHHCGKWALSRFEQTDSGFIVTCTACNESMIHTISAKQRAAWLETARQFYTSLLKAHPELRSIKKPGDYVVLKE